MDKLAVFRAIEKYTMPEPNTGCVLWIGGLDSSGYGRLAASGTSAPAHRANYIAHHGAIPAGLVCDHICRVRCCVNPAHIRLVTRAQNNVENSDSTCALNARKTHCLRGHAFTPENTKNKRGRRICRTCRRQHKREYERRARLRRFFAR